MTDRQQILETLRAHRSELEAMGVRHLALFGSRARGDQMADSDIDIGVDFADEARTQAKGLQYFGLRGRLAERLKELLSADVELSDEMMQRSRVRENYRRERVYAF